MSPQSKYFKETAEGILWFLFLQADLIQNQGCSPDSPLEKPFDGCGRVFCRQCWLQPPHTGAENAENEPNLPPGPAAAGARAVRERGSDGDHLGAGCPGAGHPSSVRSGFPAESRQCPPKGQEENRAARSQRQPVSL